MKLWPPLAVTPSALWLAALLLWTSAIAQQTPTDPSLAAQQQQQKSTHDPKSTGDPKDLATIEGRVLGSAGQPLRKSTLSLLPVYTKPGEQVQPYAATTDAEGKYVFNGVEPGRYTLFAEHAGYLRTAYGAKKNAFSGTTLALTKGLHMKDVVVQLIPQAIVSGKVLDDEGDPVAGASVRTMRKLYANGKRQMRNGMGAMTDESGEYKLSGLEPGTYYLSALPRNAMMYFGENSRKPGVESNSGKPEEELVRTYYPGVTDSASATPLEIVAGHDMPGTNIRLRKSQVVHVKGKVSGGTPDLPVHRLHVVLAERDSVFMGFAHSAPIGKDGSFDMGSVQSGSYEILLAEMQGMFSILARQPLEVGNRNVENIALNIQPPGELRGSIKVEGGGAGSDSQTAIDLSAARVMLLPADGFMINSPNAVFKSDGSFTLPNVARGKYRGNVYGTPDGTYLKSARLGDQDALNAGAEFTGGETLEVVLSATAGEIDGTVQADPPSAAQDATVLLIPDPPQPELNRLYRSIRADQNGQFILKNITPGKYRLYALEDSDSNEQFDPDYLKPVESRSVKITVEEKGRQPAAVTRITAAEFESAKPK